MTAQILAAVIFVGMFALIIMDKFERQYVTLGSAALVLVVVLASACTAGTRSKML